MTCLIQIPSEDKEVKMVQGMLIVDFKSPDIVWAHRWLIARIETYKEKIYITGIDMSSTFDTKKRGR